MAANIRKEVQWAPSKLMASKYAIFEPPRIDRIKCNYKIGTTKYIWWILLRISRSKNWKSEGWEVDLPDQDKRQLN